MCFLTQGRNRLYLQHISGQTYHSQTYILDIEALTEVEYLYVNMQARNTHTHTHTHTQRIENLPTIRHHQV